MFAQTIKRLAFGSASERTVVLRLDETLTANHPNQAVYGLFGPWFQTDPCGVERPAQIEVVESEALRFLWGYPPWFHLRIDIMSPKISHIFLLPLWSNYY